MGLSYHTSQPEGAPMVTVDRRLWLDAAGKIVEDGDPAAAFLFAAGPGEQVSEEAAKDAGYKPKPKAAPKRAAAKRKG